MKYEKKIKLILDKPIFQELKECKKKAYPMEACGLLFGIVQKSNEIDDQFEIHYICKKFYCLKANIESFGSFDLIRDTDKYYEIHQDAVDRRNLKLISIFHSHPVAPLPSGIDEKNMRYLDQDIGGKRNPFKNQIWTIMNTKDEKINAFICFNHEIMQVEIIILN